MPMPKRSDPEEYFAQLEPHQRPHMEALRELSRRVAPEAVEVLKWNLPTYVLEDNTSLWMLQNFKKHCSLRFSPKFFTQHQGRVEAAGQEYGAGFVKLPYDQPLPLDLLESLMSDRLTNPTK